MQCFYSPSTFKRAVSRTMTGRTWQQNLQAYQPLLEDTTEVPDTTIAEPEVEEQSHWERVEVEGNNLTDEELMDDARPGRRRRAGNPDPKPFAFKAKELYGGWCEVVDEAESKDKPKGKSVKDGNGAQKQWIFDENLQMIVEKSAETPKTRRKQKGGAELGGQRQN